jgi:hypothetical protein
MLAVPSIALPVMLIMHIICDVVVRRVCGETRNAARKLLRIRIAWVRNATRKLLGVRIAWARSTSRRWDGLGWLLGGAVGGLPILGWWLSCRFPVHSGCRIDCREREI